LLIKHHPRGTATATPDGAYIIIIGRERIKYTCRLEDGMEINVWCLNEFEFWCLTPLSAIFQLYHGFEVLVRKTTLKNIWMLNEENRKIAGNNWSFIGSSKSIFSLCDNILMHSSTCPQSQYSRYIYIYIYIYINYCLLFCSRQIHVYSWYVAHHLALNNNRSINRSG
jgi:hypothetical protein